MGSGCWGTVDLMLTQHQEVRCQTRQLDVPLRH